MSNILRISDAASIALHAMIILAVSPNKLVSVKDIATQLEVSENHLSKVMQRLVKAGLISSIKGKNGGFKLEKEVNSINFLEIYESIDGKFKPSSCLLGKKDCKHTCLMGGLITSVNKQVEDFFVNTKLTDFIQNLNS